MDPRLVVLLYWYRRRQQFLNRKVRHPINQESLMFNKPTSENRSSKELEASVSESETSFQSQGSRYTVVQVRKDQKTDEPAALGEIIIKEEISEDDRNQCRLCLSVGRDMKELGGFTPLYRKLLFENEYHNSTLPGFMMQLMACWECHAALRKVYQFQEKIRKTNAAFEVNQNRNCESLSTLTTFIANDNEEDEQVIIKEEVQEMEIGVIVEHIEEIYQDPLEDNKDEEHDTQISKIEAKAKAERKRKELNTFIDYNACFGKVNIEYDELETVMNERRAKKSFKSSHRKCESCILTFDNDSKLYEHNTCHHRLEIGDYVCSICEKRFSDEGQLQNHYRNHFLKYLCNVCNYASYTKPGIMSHCRKHMGVLQALKSNSVTWKNSASNSRSAQTLGA